MILVGASVDDVYVIMLFTTFTGIMQGTDMNGKEKLFTMMAYTPKATVQAAIGGIPLTLGFACGDVVLTVAVLAIVLTAPLGAFAIDSSYKKFLAKTK